MPGPDRGPSSVSHCHSGHYKHTRPTRSLCFSVRKRQNIMPDNYAVGKSLGQNPYITNSSPGPVPPRTTQVVRACAYLVVSGSTSNAHGCDLPTHAERGRLCWISCHRLRIIPYVIRFYWSLHPTARGDGRGALLGERGLLNPPPFHRLPADIHTLTQGRLLGAIRGVPHDE